MKTLGRYEIIEKVGKGGMGTVYKARQPTLNKIFALKVLAEICAKDDELVERFKREARIMAKLPDFSHVVQVFDLGEDEGKHFYTMEYIPLTLTDHIGDSEVAPDKTRRVKQKSKALPVKTIINITCHILEGLNVIHKAGVIHRDISPQNVMLAKQDDQLVAKITDFGIAGMDGSDITITGGGWLGKENYAASEQMESLKQTDERSDIYSVGILMYRMLTGRLPKGRFKEPREIRKEISSELNDVILRCMEQEPDDRFQSAKEMLRALEGALGASEAIGEKPKMPRVSSLGETMLETTEQLHSERIFDKDVADQKKASRTIVEKGNRVKKPVCHLRSKPLTVSRKQFKSAFHLDKDGRSLEYVENDFEDNGDGTVTDHATRLMWQQSGSKREMTYENAVAYIEDLNRQRFAGYSDWRLPTVDELMSLMEPEERSNNLYIAQVFNRKQLWCWSADKRAHDAAWFVNFFLNEVRCYYFYKRYYVRAVRLWQ